MKTDKWNHVFSAGVAFFAAVDLILTFSFAHVATESGGWQAGVILAIPAIYWAACAFFIAKDRPRLVIIWAMLGSEFLKLLFEFLYYCNASFMSHGLAVLSALCFVTGTLTFATVVVATARLPRRSKGQKRSSSLQLALMWIDEKRLHAVCIAFVFFIEVAILLSFAVAFDDKSCLAAGSTADVVQHPYHSLFPTLTVSDNLRRVVTVADAGKQDRIVTLFFSKDSAALDETLSEWLAHHNQSSYCSDPIVGSANTSIAERNHASLCAISAWWFDLSKDPRTRANIILVGHASNDLFPFGRKTRYHTNYELSAARTQQAILLLHRLATECESGRSKVTCNVTVPMLPGSLYSRTTWQILAGADEKPLLDSGGSATKMSSEERYRSVDVAWVTTGSEGVDVNLIDYLYFMIYTITTTGYGDLIPASATTKLITSVANLIEVLFMVLVFSLLLNADGGKSSHEVSKAGEDVNNAS